jgi:hypothetical protein
MLLLFQFLDAGPGYFGEVLGLLFMNDIDHVIDRDQAEQMVLAVHHRHAQQVILGDDARDLLLVHLGLHLDDVPVHQIAQVRPRLRNNQLAQRDNADQAPLAVHDVEIVDHLQVVGVLPQVGQRLLDGQFLRQRKHLAGHNAAGGLGTVAQQLADRLGLAGWHKAEQVLGLMLGHIGQDVRRVVRGQHLQQIGGASRSRTAPASSASSCSRMSAISAGRSSASLVWLTFNCTWGITPPIPGAAWPAPAPASAGVSCPVTPARTTCSGST